MKIGILKLPLYTNYGGILQAYALQTILERMGHNVVIFDTPKFLRLPLWRYPIVYPKRIIQKYILKKGNRILSEQYKNKIYPIVTQHIITFINQYINRLEVSDFKNLSNYDFDAIIVGSDQIWRPIYYPKIENAFLKFAEQWNIKRISYAASFGTDKWEYSRKQTKQCARLVQKFDFVSVREESGVQFCKKYFNIAASLVLDPTMLLDKKDYINLFLKSEVQKSPGNLLVYILDETPDINILVDTISKKHKLIPFRVNSRIENSKALVSDCIQPPVEQWLRGFYDAELIITDSFHACVFSIIFGKPFLVVGNKHRGLSRINTLLNYFSLQKRLIVDYTSFCSDVLFNYQTQEVLDKLDLLRKQSIGLLYESLEREV